MVSLFSDTRLRRSAARRSHLMEQAKVFTELCKTVTIVMIDK